MKICKICETEVEDNVKVCPVCENEFDEDKVGIIAKPHLENKPIKRNLGPAITIIIILVSAIIIGVICLVTFATFKNTRTSSEVVEKTSETVTNTTTTTITTTTTVQNTTIEIILNEPYYIKYNKDKDFVAMYSEANTDSKIIKKLKPNGKNAVKVTVLSKDTDDLWKVKYDGKIGYIHKNNLTIKKQKATTAKPTTTTQKVTTTQQQYISQQQNTTAYQPKATTTAKIAKKATKNEPEYYMMVY